jgi:hypothetical protein
MPELTERDIATLQYVMAELKDQRTPAPTSGILKTFLAPLQRAAAQKVWMALPLEKRKDVISHVANAAVKTPRFWHGWRGARPTGRRR